MRTSVLPSPPLRFTSSRSLLVILLSLPRPSLQRTHHVQESQCLLLLSVFKQILFLPPADSPQRLHSWNFSFSVCPVWRWCQEAFPCWACSAFLRERVCFRLRGCTPLQLPQDMWTPLLGCPALSAAVEKPKPVRFFFLLLSALLGPPGGGGRVKNSLNFKNSTRGMPLSGGCLVSNVPGTRCALSSFQRNSLVYV